MTDDRYFFVHLQKTAGTSLIRRIRGLFGFESVYPGRGDGDIVTCVISVPRLLERWAARAEEIRVVTGHFPLCTAELLSGRFRTFTILREPVERTLSYLRHHRQLTPAEQDRSLEEIYSDPLRFHGLAHNHMVKMLSLSVDEMTDGVLTRVDFTDERLARAKQRLSEVDIFGLQERYEDFCADLERGFGWQLGEPLHANRTAPVEVPDSFRERIAVDNAMDVELYEFAARLYERRRRDHVAP